MEETLDALTNQKRLIIHESQKHFARLIERHMNAHPEMKKKLKEVERDYRRKQKGTEVLDLVPPGFKFWKDVIRKFFPNVDMPLWKNRSTHLISKGFVKSVLYKSKRGRAGGQVLRYVIPSELLKELEKVYL